MPNKPPIDVDLFAGAGGLSIGLKKAGFTTERYYELDPYACKTLKYNIASEKPTLSGEVVPGDVKLVDWEKCEFSVRLLAGGAPCQPFSLAGKHKAEQDGRNQFPEVLRAIRTLRPKAVLLENVRGLARPSFDPYFQYILRQMRYPSVRPASSDELWEEHDKRLKRHEAAHPDDQEYRVKAKPMDAADYGIPQNRLRVFIVATSRELPEYQFPDETHSKLALLHNQSTGDYWERHGLCRPRAAVRRDLPEEEKKLLPWKTVRDALADLWKPSNNEESALMNHWVVKGARVYPGHAGSQYDWPSKTIKAGVHGVPGGENILIRDDGSVRYFTLRETARLQTFPNEHFFEGARLHVTRQIGNAVPCDLAAVVAGPLSELLSQPLAKDTSA